MARSRGGSGRFWGGFALGLVLAAACAAAYAKYGPSKGRVAGPTVALEKSMAPQPANAPIDREVKTAPFGTSEDVFEAGAYIYKNQCASCHGTPGHDVAFAKYMNPAAPQLWKKHAHGNVVGVSDDETGETFGKVADGIHQSGMPSYQHVLSDTQMWQVSLLLKNADQQLPDPVMAILKK